MVLRKTRVELAPRLKLRGLSECGCNLFSAQNDHQGFLHRPWLNRFSRSVVSISSTASSGQSVHIDQPVRLQFIFSTTDGSKTPLLDSYRLAFEAAR